MYGRLSPPLIIEFMTTAVRQLRAHLGELPADAPAAFPVSWAGESASSHWFDVAREYTERWHHQAQIREAVGTLAPLMRPRLYAPVLQTFMHAVPHALRHVAAAEGAVVRVDVDGEAGGVWHVRRHAGTWHLDVSARSVSPGREAAVASVWMPGDLAWQLFTNGATVDEVRQRCRWDGDQATAHTVIGARAIVG